MSVKIKLAFRDANAAHKAAIMLESIKCPVVPLYCGFCPYDGACKVLKELATVLKEAKDEE